MLTISLITPNIRYGSQMLWSVLPSRGLLSLGAVLRDSGYSCQFIDADIDNLSNTDVIRKIDEFRSGLGGLGLGLVINIICITMNSFQAFSGLELAGAIRNWSNSIGVRTVIIVGGPHASAFGKKLLEENRCIDFVCRGEGEETIVEVIKEIIESGISGNESGNNFGSIKGISYRYYDDVYENSDRPRIQNLDSIPFPAYELIGNIGKYPGAAPVLKGPSMHVMASRGCPYRCTFCSSRNVWGHIVRFRSPQNIVDEVEILHNVYGINEVFFQDDTMNVNREWFFSVCNEIINRKKIGRLGGMENGMTFKAPFRVNSSLIDMELLLKAKEAGFWIIFYGVESGNQKVLDIIEKGITVDEVRRAFILTHNAGIKTIAAFMVGNIGDTVESVDDSIRLAKEICVRGDICGFSIACPLPGTEFYKIAKEKGWIENLDYRNYSTFGAVARNEALTAGQIAELAGRANGEVYRYLNS